MRAFLRRVLPVLTAFELVSGALILVRGFPYFGSAPVRPAPLWELPVALFHLPAITALELTGHCCGGLGENMVIGPRIRAGHIRVTARGGFILLATNWFVWVSLSLLIWVSWRRWKGTRQPSPSASRPSQE